MSKYRTVLKVILPFTLTLTAGIGLSSWLRLGARPAYTCATAILEKDSDSVEIKSAVILSKPEPFYPRAARRNQVEGIVSLRVVLRPDGKVSGIKPLKTLPYGLTEEAVKAAKRIEFLPATFNGKPSFSEMLVEYYFSSK